jgi:hypothetical protein
MIYRAAFRLAATFIYRTSQFLLKRRALTVALPNEHQVIE